MYKLFFRLVFQRMDPEQAHHLAFRWIRLVARIHSTAYVRRRRARAPPQGVADRGVRPADARSLGLAAGLDKNAVAIDGMSMLGFDHVEIGTVTGEPQPGNPKKRLFRLRGGPGADQPHGVQQRGLRGRQRAPGGPAPRLPDRRGRQHRQDQGRYRGGGRRRLREVDRAARPARGLPRGERGARRTRPACATSRRPRHCGRC